MTTHELECCIELKCQCKHEKWVEDSEDCYSTVVVTISGTKEDNGRRKAEGRASLIVDARNRNVAENKKRTILRICTNL